MLFSKITFKQYYLRKMIMSTRVKAKMLPCWLPRKRLDFYAQQAEWPACILPKYSLVEMSKVLNHEKNWFDM